MGQREKEQNEKRRLDTQNSTGGKQAHKTTQLQTCVTFHKIVRMTRRWNHVSRAKSPWWLFPGLEIESRKVKHLPDFKTIMDPWLSLTFTSPCLSQNIYKHYPMPSYNRMLGVLGWINGLFSVTDGEQQCPSNCIYWNDTQELHLYLDLI